MFKKILLVDDDELALSSTKRYLEGRGFNVAAADNGAGAVAMARESKPDLVITDVQMKGLDGFALCRAIKETEGFTGIPVIIISGSKISEEDILAGYNRGADDYLLKPFSFPVLLAKLKAVMKRYEGVAEKEKPASAAGSPRLSWAGHARTAGLYARS